MSMKEDKAAVEHSKQIDARLEIEARNAARHIKLLLLGKYAKFHCLICLILFCLAESFKDSVIVSRDHTDKCVISGLLSVWIRTAVCASIYHTIHTLALTLTLILTLSLSLNPTLTLNLTLISSYLTNKHQYPQCNMSAN